jgi:hypothetical protein
MAAPHHTGESDPSKEERSYGALSALFTPAELEQRAHAIVAASDRRLAAQAAERAQSKQASSDAQHSVSRRHKRRHKRKHKKRTRSPPACHEGSVSEADQSQTGESPPDSHTNSGKSVAESTSGDHDSAPTPSQPSSRGVVSGTARGQAEANALRQAILACALKADPAHATCFVYTTGVYVLCVPTQCTCTLF